MPDTPTIHFTGRQRERHQHGHHCKISRDIPRAPPVHRADDFGFAINLGCSWHLAQLNVIGKAPFARLIGLTYSLMSMGGVAWFFEPRLLFGHVGEPMFAASLTTNLILISLRFHHLYEKH